MKKKHAAKSKAMARAVFLDRDGTINKDTGYLHKIKDFRILPGAFKALKKISEKYLLFIVTNQSGIGRNRFKSNDVERLNNYIEERMKKNSVHIKKIYYCPHLEKDRCICRKPETFFLEMAKKEFNIDLKASYVIGDKESDIMLGKNAGCRTVLVLTGKIKKKDSENISAKPDIIARNLSEAADMILKE